MGKKHVIPGFGMTLGTTVSFLCLLILIPLASILARSFQMSAQEFMALITRPNVAQAFRTSIGCSLIAALINTGFGFILAWTLVKYEFPGKALMDGMIELPLAMPTAVAGITLTKLYSDQGMFGKALGRLGIKVSYTRLGIIVAMVFVGIPFVVRSVQPVLEKLSPCYEEAAAMLGASKLYIVRRVLLPELLPALLTGFGLALSRGIGEYGSVIYISGNSAKEGTQVVSYVIMQKLNAGNVDYEGAAAIALVLLLVSFFMLLVINLLQRFTSQRTKF